MSNKKEFKVENNLDLFEYLALIDTMVDGFFDENKEYVPQVGMLNLMRVFYNVCVKESPYDEKYPHDVIDAGDMAELVKDKTFIEEFNKAYKGDGSGYIDYNFSIAVQTAMDIVNVKKSSFGNAVETVSSLISGLMDKISPLMTKEVMGMVADIADGLNNGKLTVDSVVNGFIERLKIDEKEKEENEKIKQFEEK